MFHLAPRQPRGNFALRGTIGAKNQTILLGTKRDLELGDVQFIVAIAQKIAFEVFPPRKLTKRQYQYLRDESAGIQQCFKQQRVIIIDRQRCRQIHTT